ncbi:2-isopropylmalate synthase [Pantoea agglomerans]|uniref:2-isopropylmalate synthase n=1 Tax=Enterobacter agglomerans TaxID=549 RepID=A0A379ALK0_ENTAG|nr:2-isopropylmalate synthase [Pantoea agglomerans]
MTRSTRRLTVSPSSTPSWFNYKLTAKGHGENALGQVDIVVSYNGRKFHGIGLATDIVESSAKAMVNALNNIWRARQVEQELQRKFKDQKETV